MAALAEPQTIKISSKRQITIPAKLYQEMGFDEYALCTWTDKGLLIQPLAVDDEDVTVEILRYLIGRGYGGDELIEQYQSLRPRTISLKAKLKEAEDDIAAGRVGSFDEMQDRIKDTYGL